MGYEHGPKQSSLRGEPLHGGALSLRLEVRDRVLEVPRDDECTDRLEAVAMPTGDGLEKSSGLSGLTRALSSLTSSSVFPVDLGSSCLVGLKKLVTRG